MRERARNEKLNTKRLVSSWDLNWVIYMGIMGSGKPPFMGRRWLALV
jgi:hypothetical protein